MPYCPFQGIKLQEEWSLARTALISEILTRTSSIQNLKQSTRFVLYSISIKLDNSEEPDLRLRILKLINKHKEEAKMKVCQPNDIIDTKTKSRTF